MSVTLVYLLESSYLTIVISVIKGGGGLRTTCRVNRVKIEINFLRGIFDWEITRLIYQSVWSPPTFRVHFVLMCCSIFSARWSRRGAQPLLAQQPAGLPHLPSSRATICWNLTALCKLAGGWLAVWRRESHRATPVTVCRIDAFLIAFSILHSCKLFI